MSAAVIDSAPVGAAPVVAPSSQDIETIRQQQDAAWDDTSTDTGSDIDASGTPPPSDETPPDGDVIVDKPGLSGTVVPPPKPGATKPSITDGTAADHHADDDKGDGDVKPVKDERTAEQKSQDYWLKVSEAHPTAKEDSASPQFLAWFNTLSPADRAAASKVESPEESVKLMGRYYADLRNGKVPEPPPPPEVQAFDAADFIKSNNLADRKIKLANGEETTLGHMAKPEEFGDLISAMGAISAASEQSVMNKATQLIQNLINQGVLVTGEAFSKLRDRIGDKELEAVVPEAQAMAADPQFKNFVAKSKLYKAAWDSGDTDQRAEVIGLFKATKAGESVSAAAANQRRSTAAKGALHSGTLRGGSAPARATDDAKSAGEVQDQAWDTPIDVEGQKV